MVDENDQVVMRRVRDAYESDHARLWRSLYAFSGSRHVADESAAEAFAQVLRRGVAVADVRAWVWRAAFAIARGDLKSRQERSGPLDTESSGPTVEDPGDDGLAAVMASLAVLSERDRELLVLCHVGGWLPSELAPLVGVSAPTLRVRLHRATRRARALLDEREHGERDHLPDRGEQR
jgi:RNA polymerase sigma-70 factor (ECF subfamily)